jgi:hypothetical protein
VAGVLTTHQQKENTMTATAVPARTVGERVELGRYRTTTSERILHGQRINGVVRFLVAGRVVVVAWAVA